MSETVHPAMQPAPSRPCVMHAGHSPRITRTVNHHVLPQETQKAVWGTVALALTVACCDVGHANIHGFLDGLAAGFSPSRSEAEIIGACRFLESKARSGWKPAPLHRMVDLDGLAAYLGGL